MILRAPAVQRDLLIGSDALASAPVVNPEDNFQRIH
jgi:hypothetical protein